MRHNWVKKIQRHNTQTYEIKAQCIDGTLPPRSGVALLLLVSFLQTYGFCHGRCFILFCLKEELKHVSTIASLSLFVDLLTILEYFNLAEMLCVYLFPLNIPQLCSSIALREVHDFAKTLWIVPYSSSSLGGLELEGIFKVIYQMCPTELYCLTEVSQGLSPPQRLYGHTEAKTLSLY